MKALANQNRRLTQVINKTPVALAAALLASAALSQPAESTTSADAADTASLFSTGGQATIGPRPFTSFLQRLGSPVDVIQVQAAADNLPADGVGFNEVVVTLKDKDGQLVADEVDVTIEVSGGARVVLPGRTTPEAGADRGDIDRITPGVQATVSGGVLQIGRAHV